MLPDGRRLGAHLNVADGMIKAADRAAAIGATALQIFGDNPTAWTRRTEPASDRSAFRARLAEQGIDPLVVHASYLVNLAGPDPGFFERSIGLLAAELRDAVGAGARHVNVHIGSHRGTGVEVGIERLAEGILRTLEAADADADGAGAAGAAGDDGAGAAIEPSILLENSSGGGGGLGVDVNELAAIAAAIERRGIPRGRVGFCLDTAHAWGAGHDLSDPATTDELLAAFDAQIGLDRLPVVHLNDSKSGLGSRMDRHEHIGAGQIGEVGMAHLLRHPLLADVAYILETPGMDQGYDAINIARAIALARGEPLAPLPPGALTIPGSRSRTATAVASDPPSGGMAGQ
ncbi:MAG TPA: TIM barrel protein [Candidatus Limnocylindrales bacterium]|nr:TIM barrel protein [Candidatus Limnocylindrales bacterium]